MSKDCQRSPDETSVMGAQVALLSVLICTSAMASGSASQASNIRCASVAVRRSIVGSHKGIEDARGPVVAAPRVVCSTSVPVGRSRSPSPALGVGGSPPGAGAVLGAGSHCATGVVTVSVMVFDTPPPGAGLSTVIAHGPGGHSAAADT